MLDRDEAKRRMDEVERPDGKKEMLKALRSLPKELCDIGRALLGDYDAERPSYYYLRDPRALPMIPRFGGLKPKDREKLYRTMFGHMADDLLLLDRYLTGGAYDDGYTRYPFRAPNDPSAGWDRRFHVADRWADLCKEHDQPLEWFAIHAPYLWSSRSTIGLACAAVIDQGGKRGTALRDLLIASAKNEHEVGAMGEHVCFGLLGSADPAAWEFIEKLLLAAQRQEGLRSEILGAVHRAHPLAFRRMLRLVLEHDLVRFSAVTQAVNGWLGYEVDSESTGFIRKTIERVLKLLDDPKAREAALKGKAADEAYEALWAIACDDAEAAIPRAAALLKDKSAERRFAAATLLVRLDLPAARAALLPHLADPDPRVFRVIGGHLCVHSEDLPPGVDLFGAIEAYLPKLPLKSEKQEPLVWPWTEREFGRPDAAEWLCGIDRGGRPPTCMIPHLKLLGGYSRSRIATQLGDEPRWDDATRTALLTLLIDSKAMDEAAKALAKKPLRAEDGPVLEGYLTRKGTGLRHAVFKLLAGQADDHAFESAERLLESKTPEQRLGGLELLRTLAESNRERARCQSLAQAYREKRTRLTEAEATQLSAITGAGEATLSMVDGLGLFDPARLTSPVPPKARKASLTSQVAGRLLKTLDELIERHKDLEYVDGNGVKRLIGEDHYAFPRSDDDLPLEADLARLPHRLIWEEWHRTHWRPMMSSPMESHRLDLAMNEAHPFNPRWDWRKVTPIPEERPWVLKYLGPSCKVKFSNTIARLKTWFERLDEVESNENDGSPMLLDAAETVLANLPPIVLTAYSSEDSSDDEDDDDDDESTKTAEEPTGPVDMDAITTAIRNRREAKLSDKGVCALWRQLGSLLVNLLEDAVRATAQSGDDGRLHHAWDLRAWVDRPGPNWSRDRGPDYLILEVHARGIAGDVDLLDHLAGADHLDPANEGKDPRTNFSLLKKLTEIPPARPRPKAEPHDRLRFPKAAALADRVRERLLEVELARGEAPTVATPAVKQVSTWPGLATLVKLHRVLGRQEYARQGWSWRSNDGRAEVFSLMISRSRPTDADTPETFKTAMAEFGEERLLQLAFFNPAWLPHVANSLGWKDFIEGVYWFLAHTRYGNEVGDGDEWAKILAERTPLTKEDRSEGSVDIAWFHRVHASLGPKRWVTLAEASKFGNSAQGHKAAQFLSDTLLGKVKKAELVKRIREKHARDAVRCLGLLPLAKGAAQAKDVLERYRILGEYHKYAKGLGAMSKEGALRTAEMGMANLARTAGYPDPIRFSWAMERESVADLAKGPLTVTAGDVTVSLAVDSDGQPCLSADKGGKTLKSIPADVKKQAKVAPLVERLAELKKQRPRCKEALERMMCRGDTFTGAEVRQLMVHPILAPLLTRLVLVGTKVAGFPVNAGTALLGADGRETALKPADTVRIAHPTDFHAAKSWPAWQKDCFAREVIQPFKQVFRELYVPTKTESDDRLRSRRYAGQQVNPSQATALFGARAWTVSMEEGVSRTWHEDGIVADVGFLFGGGTSVDVEGWTIEAVEFRRKGEWKPIAPAEVPSRVFSECMRDLDLVVSVAHRGGVDPEATASTVEMRAALVRETAALLKLGNVKVKDHHVIIKGKLAEYSIHLGGGGVHRLPGGSICLIPVHAQHRGRIFLPFADDDPKTAEIVSKVLLLSKDHEIQDPSILSQLLS